MVGCFFDLFDSCCLLGIETKIKISQGGNLFFRKFFQPGYWNLTEHDKIFYFNAQAVANQSPFGEEFGQIMGLLPVSSVDGGDGC